LSTISKPIASSDTEAALSIAAKTRLAIRVWHRYLFVRRRIKRKRLPDLVRELSFTSVRGDRRSPELLSLAVHRSLRIGPHQPRCLFGALVLYRLLREQGDEAELVIGLRRDARDHEAHAWVEVAGRDAGPPPGRGEHVAMARFS
jgi:hypothetical protein